MTIIPLDILNWFVGFGAVILEAGTVALVVLLYLEKKNQTAAELSGLVRRFGLWLGLILSLCSVGVSLYYSDVLGFLPCGLCWLIRICSYPLVILFAVALYKKDTRVADYVIALSGVGLLIGLYQHYLQLGGADVLPCPATGPGPDCAARILSEFGHVTFPWVAVAMFAFIIATMLHIRRRSTS